MAIILGSPLDAPEALDQEGRLFLAGLPSIEHNLRTLVLQEKADTAMITVENLREQIGRLFAMRNRCRREIERCRIFMSGLLQFFPDAHHHRIKDMIRTLD